MVSVSIEDQASKAGPEGSCVHGLVAEGLFQTTYLLLGHDVLPGHVDQHENREGPAIHLDLVKVGIAEMRVPARRCSSHTSDIPRREDGLQFENDTPEQLLRNFFLNMGK